jgi:hypothetical protein
VSVPLDKAARRAWLAGAADTRFGVCDTCKRDRTVEGRFLLVARQAGSRRYLCLDCWDEEEGSR